MREINRMLGGYGLEDSRGFVDDLLTGGSSWEDYLNHQRQLFLACRDYNLMVTVTKIRIGYSEIGALGHKVC